MDSIGPQDLAIAALAAVALAAIVTQVVRGLRVLESARHDASTDPLTGLGNRRQLMEDLEDEIARASDDSPRVVALLDLDGFKGYNDAFGHPSGDALLARLGRALNAAVCPWGSAYRLGGDEFCVLVRDRAPGLEAVISAAAAALSDRGKGFEVRPSCGMVALPQEANTPEATLELAERRLYAEKNGRRLATAGADAREALQEALRERKPARPEQLEGVAALARATGRQLGLESDELDVVVRAAELNDVGKMALPDTILSKPGPLSEEEWGYFQQHALVGDRILSASGAMVPVAKLVRSSHEHFDGSGYPDALAGEEIPLGSRIIAVCDAYHAMTSDRPYRPKAKPADAFAGLRQEAGSQFDPAVVDAFGIALGHTGPRATAPRVRTLLASAAVAVALMCPAGAMASTASISGSQLVVTAIAPETNRLEISATGSDLQVKETGTGATLTSGAGCVTGAANQVNCPLAGIGSIAVEAGDGNDRVTVTASLPATLFGGADSDVLYGGPLADALDGGSGNDWLGGGLGADNLIGGSGSDGATWSTRSAPVTADLDDIADDGESGEGDNAHADIETLIGGSAGDTLTGSSANNGLDGGAGSDTLNGGAGEDFVLYGFRTTPVHVDLGKNGGNGESGENDWIGDDVENVIGGKGDDTLIGDAGDNDLWGWEGNDTLEGGTGADVLWGSYGSDLVTYASRTSTVSASLDNVANDGESGEGDNIYDVESLTGGAGADLLVGSAVANSLIGGPGGDTLVGHDGDDLFGVRDDEEDNVTCGNGTDSVTGDSRDVVATDCDSVDTSADPSRSEKVPGDDPKTTADDPAEVQAGAVRVDGSGNALVRVKCPATVLTGCTGTVTIKLLGKRQPRASLSARKRKGRKGVLGSGSFSLKPGQSATIKVKLSRNGRRRVLRQRKVRCSVNVTTVAEDGSRSVTKQIVTLKAPKVKP